MLLIFNKIADIQLNSGMERPREIVMRPGRFWGDLRKYWIYLGETWKDPGETLRDSKEILGRFREILGRPW